jgi:Tol biopolymer transport system component
VTFAGTNNTAGCGDISGALSGGEMKYLTGGLLMVLLTVGVAAYQDAGKPAAEEKHLANVRKITSVPGALNAEAYFSFDGKKLIFQSTRPPHKCDQIYTMNLDGSDVRLVSTGTGRTTCAYFLTGDSRILYASTHEGAPDCPPPPDMSQGYVWAVYDDYDLYSARADGTDLRKLTRSHGYDAEATVSPDGTRIIWTSQRDGDLDIYSMKPDGTDVRRLTDDIGYDGGAFYSWDNRRIVYRAHHPATPPDVERYRRFLSRGLVEGRTLEVMVMNADGTGKRRLTNNGRVNFAPFFHPNNRQIIFSSNANDPKGRSFHLCLMNADGTGLEQVTFDGTFNSFPMFNRDGTKLVFASSGHGSTPGEINIFLADWKP